MKKAPFLIFFVLLAIPLAYAQNIPKVNTYLTDKAGILSSATKTQLEHALSGLESTTNGVQFIIYIENEYPKGYSLEEYTLKIAENNGIGQKEEDNGVLLYIAIKDRVYRWEIGYGAESTLNTPLLGRVSRQYLEPNFKNGDYEKGIVETFDVVGKILLNSNDPDIAKLKNEPETPKISKSAVIILLIGLSIFLLILMGAAKQAGKSKKRFGGYTNHYYTGAAGSIFAGGFGKGRFGGGFGGFSGGGGNFGGGGFGGRF